MGGAISQIESANSYVSKCIERLRSLTLDEIVTFYSSVKTRTDKMSINFSEFNDIFELGLEDFNIWDTEHRNLINIFEFLTGVVMIGKMSFDARVNCLFDFFDFNNVGRLCNDELRLMITIVCQSVSKIKEVSLHLKDSEIENFTKKIIDNEKDISVGKLIYVLRKNSLVVRLFLALGHESPMLASLTKEETVHMLQNPSSKIPHSIRDYPDYRPKGIERCSEILKGSAERQRSFILLSLMEEVAKNQIYNLKTADVQTEWVFGFEPTCSLIPLSVSKVENETKELVYMIEKFVVIYNPKEKRQRLFQAHREEVTLVTVSEDGKIVASAEGNLNPRVIVWEKRSMKILLFLSIPSISSVYLLSFVYNDSLLVILTKKPNPGIYIHDLKSKKPLHSSTISDFVIKICQFVKLFPFPKIDSEDSVTYNGFDLDKSIFLIGNHLFTYLLWDIRTSSYIQYFFDPLTSFSKKCSSEYIRDGIVFFRHSLNTKGFLFSNKLDFHLEIWMVTDLGNLVKAKSEIESNRINFEKEVVQLGLNIKSYSNISLFDSDTICLLTDKQELLFVSVTTSSIISRIDLTVHLISISNNIEIYKVLIYSKNKLLLCGRQGEVLQIRVKGQKTFDEKEEITSFNQIFSISRKSQHILVSSETKDNHKLYVYGGEDSITVVSMESRSVIERIVLGDTITSLDVLSYPDKPVMMAAGTVDGTIRVRLDYTFLSKSFKYPHIPTMLRFSSSGSHLLCSTSEPSLLLFTLSSGNYFYDVPKIILDQEEIFWMNFGMTDEDIYFGTNNQKTYMIKVSEFREKKLKVINLSEININRTLQLRLGSDNIQNGNPCIVYSQTGLVIRADDHGSLLLYPSFKTLFDNSCTIKHLHSSKISSFAFNSNDRLIFTIADNTGSMLCSSIKLSKEVIHDQRISKELCILTSSLLQNLIACSIQKISASNLRDSYAYMYGLSSNYLQSIFAGKAKESTKINTVVSRCPPVYLELVNVYGSGSTVFKNSVMYLHHNVEEMNFELIESNSSGRQPEEGGRKTIDNDALRRISNFSENLKNRKKTFVNQITGVDDTKEAETRNKTLKFNLDFSNFKNQMFFSQHFGSSINSINNKDCQLNKTRQPLMDCPLAGKNCCRRVIYFISRLIVIIDSPHLDNPPQRFYERHNGLITSFAVNPKFDLVASSESGERPSIHIWEIVSCNTLKIILTSHLLGIVQLRFSSKGDLVFSTAADLNSSIQVSDINSGMELAFRNTSSIRTFELVSSPCSNNLFITLKAKRLDVWRIDSTSLINEWFIDDKELIKGSCMIGAVFINYKFRGQVTNDILLMTSYTQLLVIRDREVIHSVNLAKGKPILNPQFSNLDEEFEKTQLLSESFKRKSSIKRKMDDSDDNSELGEENSVSHDSQEFSDCLSEQSDLETLFQPKLSFIRKSTLKTTKQKYNVRSDSYNQQSVSQLQSETDTEPINSTSVFDCSMSHMKHFLLYDTFFLTVVNDSGYLLIYSIDFVLEFEYNISEALIENKQRRNQQASKSSYAIQSIDLYISNLEIFFIMTLANGCMLELSVNYNYKLSKRSNVGKVLFSVGSHRVLSRFHSSPCFEMSTNPFDFQFNRRVYLATSNVFNIIASAGDDCQLFILDFEKRAVVSCLNLDERPSALKFSPNGKLLVVGFLSGRSAIFEIKVEMKIVNGVQLHLFSIGEPSQVITPDWMLNKTNSPRSVIAIEFCRSGDLMAVSYDNAKLIPARNQNEETDRLSYRTSDKDSPSSVVIIYVSRDSSRRNEFEETGNDDLYSKYTEVRLASLYYADTSKMSLLGMAVHFLLFSENSNYLMLYYQNTNQYRIREHKDRDGKYVIWNFKSKSAEINPDTLKSIKFNGINFPTHIIVKEKLVGIDKVMELMDLTEEPEITNKYISSVMIQGDMLIMGAEDGDLLISEIRALNNVDSRSMSSNFSQPIIELGNEQNSMRAKMLMSHSSAVTQLEMSVNSSYMFTVSESDECILQWKVIGLSESQRSNTQHHEDSETRLPVDNGPSNVLTKEHISNSQLDQLIFKILPSRKQFLSLKEHTSPLIFPKFSLNLKQILGRKHSVYSNHLLSFSKNEFCYFAGTNVVITRLHSRNNLPQLLKEEKLIVKTKISEEEGLDDNSKHHTRVQYRSMVNNRNAINQSLIRPEHQNFIKYRKSVVAEDNISETKVFISQQLFDCSYDSFVANNKYRDRSFNYTSEIGAIEINGNRELLYTVTNDIYSRVSVWKISTMSLVNWNIIQNCVVPLIIRLSHPNNSIVVLGLNHEKMPCLFFLLPNLTLLSVAYLRDDNRFFINDISFKQNNYSEFITVGYSHASMWISKGNLLQEQEMKMTVDEDSDESLISFLLIRFINHDLFITTSVSGAIQLWYDGKIKESKMIFSNSAVSAFAQNPEDPMEILLGGQEQRLELLQILKKDNLYTLVSIYSVQLLNADPLQQSALFQSIESLLVINKRYLVVGQKDGSFATIRFNFEDFDKEKRARKNINQLTYFEKQEKLSVDRFIFPLIHFFDEDVPLVADFSLDNNSLYLIGQNGSFVIFDIETLLPIYQNDFKKKTLDLVNLLDGILLVFEDSLLILKIRDAAIVIDEETTRLITKASKISKVRFHRNSGFLAIGFEGFKDQSSIIEIFKTGDVFEKFHTLETDELLLLDFSSEDEDKLYLMYSDIVGKTEIFRIEHDQVIIESRSDIIWSTDGFLISSHCSELFVNQLQWSDVVSVFLIDPETLVLLDKEGTVK